MGALEWAAAKTPLQRRIRRYREGRFLPSNLPSKPVYTALYTILFITAFVNYVASFPLRYGPIQNFLFVYVPTWLIAIVAAGQLVTTHWWHKAGKGKVGTLPPYTYIARDKWRRVKPFAWEDKEGEVRVTVYEMNRFGGLIEGVIEGNGPVVIAPILQEEVNAEMTVALEDLKAQGVGASLTLPASKVKDLSSGVKMGAEFVVPGDPIVYVLGNSERDRETGEIRSLDGLERDFRRWAMESYPDLSPLAGIVVCYDSVRAASDVLRGYNANPHYTNYEWALADKERRINELEHEAMRLRQRMSRARGFESEGGEPFAVLPEEELR